MSDIHGFTLGRGTLRALFHAQGQLVNAHNRALLFYAAEVINAAKPHLDPQTHEDAINSAKALAPLKDDPYNIDCLMGFQVNGTLAAALEVLAEIKDTDLGNDSINALVAKTHDYIDMARSIQQPEYQDGVVHVSQIDPILAAEFVNLYMRQFVSSKPPLTANLMSNPLAQDKRDHLYEVGEDNKDYISILLDDLSAEADYCRHIAQSNAGMDEYDPRMYRLYQLFQSTAVFDWRQYEEGAAAKEDMPQATVLEFKAPVKVPKISHG